MRLLSALALLLALALPTLQGQDGKGGITVDKEKRTITIDARIAPRKLPHLKGEVYPIEVIACLPHPLGKKAHETVVNIDVKPGVVLKALEDLGLKPGRPVMGGKDQPQGPEVKVYLDTGERKLTMDKFLIDSRTKKPFPKNVQWRVTGSVLIKPDPTKDEKILGADDKGTLMVIFPVTNETILQTNLTMEDERFMKLETNTDVLPKEGTAVKLVLQVPAAK